MKPEKRKFSVREVYGISDFAYKSRLDERIPRWKRIFLSINEIRIASLEVDIEILKRNYDRLEHKYKKKIKKKVISPDRMEAIRKEEAYMEDLMEEISRRIYKKKEAIERIRNFR